MSSAIAVVGMDGRFPGAEDLDAYWSMLVGGASGIRPVDEERWRPDGVRGPWDHAGLMEDPAAFDAAFFGISPAEAHAMDPQQRIVLETAWRAVEDGGTDPRTLAGRRVGVFVGVMGSEWAQLTLGDPESMTPQLGTGNGYCIIANRVSYVLGVTGPSLAVDSACSSSLLALHLACSALRNGDCDEAIVVGVNVVMTPSLGRFYATAGLAAKDGQCKPFSREADGIVRGEAVVGLHLVPGHVAAEQHRPARAMVLGSAVNQDGRSNGLTAPHRAAQVDVLRRAMGAAGLEPTDVVAVECHGTGTVLGDMIEANALGDAYGKGRSEPLRMGSVKGNIGHTEGAAGLAGVAKMVLALEHRLLPPTRHAATENPALRLDDKNLRLLSSAERIRGRRPAVGVSSFGLGGTNVHVLLGPGPRTPAAPVTNAPAVPGVVTVAAPDAAALSRNTDALAGYLATANEPVVADVARATHRLRSVGRHRVAVLAADARELQDRLARAARGQDGPGIWRPASGEAADRPVVGWVFAGQGTEHPGMAVRLAQEIESFARHMDDVVAHIDPLLGTSLLDAMRAEDDRLLRSPRLVQPAILAHELALAFTLRDAGLEPAWVGGHSIGEVAAAVVTGALDLAGAAALVVARGVLTEELPPTTGMTAVSGDDVGDLVGCLPDGVEVAARNAPDQLVLAGDLTALAEVEAALGDTGLRTTRLATTRAFHSRAVEPIVDRFAQALDVLPPGGCPDRPFYSSRLGRFLETGERLGRDHWVAHLRDTVLFDGLAATAPRTDLVVEIGPARALARLLRHGALARTPVSVVSPGVETGAADLLATLARAFVEGVQVRFPGDDEHAVARVPGYAFDRSLRVWRSAGPARRTDGPAPEPPPQAAPDRDESDLLAWVRATVARVGRYEPGQVGPHVSLVDDLYFDSVMVVQLCAAAADELGMDVDVAALLRSGSTPTEIEQYLREHHAAQPGALLPAAAARHDAIVERVG